MCYGPEQFEFQAPRNPQKINEAIETPIDNSLDNMGAGDSYFTYGADWGHAGSAPFRGAKEDIYEGGIHSPAIIAGPGVTIRGQNEALLHVTDVMPTILNYAKSIDYGADCDYDGQLSGKNWAPMLAGQVSMVRNEKDVSNWELFFRRAVREGTLKAVYHPTRLQILGPLSKPGETEWQLFDLANDPGETRDLSAERPDVLKRLVAKWYTYADEKNVVMLDDEEQPEDVGLAH